MCVFLWMHLNILLNFKTENKECNGGQKVALIAFIGILN